MKIAFDMQAFQSVNRLGGIGNYNYDFLSTLFDLYPENMYKLFFNKLEEQEKVKLLGKTDCTDLVPVKYFPGKDLNFLNQWIQFINYRLSSVDITHILSPFEPQQHAVIQKSPLPSKIVLTIYDFIPLIFKDLYLAAPGAERFYRQRLEILKRADLLLSISESTRQDAIRLFSIPPEKIFNIGIAASDHYYKMSENDVAVADIQKKYQIGGKFVLTVSNLDHRKNLLRLLKAYSSMRSSFLNEFVLIVVTNSVPEYVNNNKEINELLARNNDVKVKFLYSIPDSDLRVLYNTCELFVYASLYEGGGLPVIEAMKCGAAVIASDTSSIPEYVGKSDHLFDPYDLDNMIVFLETYLSDENLRSQNSEFGLAFSKSITWENVADRAMIAYQQIV